MRQALESWLLKNWYGTVSPPNPVLRLLEPLYRLIVKIRRRLVNPAKLNRPVIIVGNLTAGGSGKTPLVIALCRLLHENGIAVGVISRGYGRASSTTHRVSDQDDANVAGDEPLLISRHTDAVVAVADKRIEAAALLDTVELDILIADDGLQHYQLPRAMEICVIDGIRRFGNGHLLPAGPLREPLSRLEEVDYLVCNGGPAKAGELQMSLTGGVLKKLDDSGESALADWRGRAVDAIAGIGNPGRFFQLLRDAGLDVNEQPFPDHHAYCADDFDPRSGRPLIMTEKDAVKCTDFGLVDAWYLPVHAEISEEFKNEFVNKVDKMLQSGNPDQTA